MSCRSKILKCWGLLVMSAFLLTTVRPVRAQSVTAGMLSGIVIDQQNAVLPGVGITAVHQPTGTQYAAVSDTEGRFQIPNVRAGGPYTLTASLSGFRDERMENVNVGLGEDRPVLFKMVLAAVSETVNVVGQSAFTTTQAGTATNVGQGAVENLPTIARSIGDVARINPFFNQTQSDNGDSFLSVAGTHNRYNNLQIDGAVNNDLFGLAASGTPGGQTGTQPISLDAIQELQLVVSPYDVRQGGFAGGSVNAITRSGTNQFSGTAYMFARNENLVGKGSVDREGRTVPGSAGWLQRRRPDRAEQGVLLRKSRFRTQGHAERLSIDGSTGQNWGHQAGCAAHHRHLEEQIRVRPWRRRRVQQARTTTTKCLSAPTSTFGPARADRAPQLRRRPGRQRQSDAVRLLHARLLLRDPGHDEFDRGSAEHDAGFDVQRTARHLPARAQRRAVDGVRSRPFPPSRSTSPTAPT